ncbi:glucosaminidase domain-containing protein [Flavobacterium sp.]|uniref:glucosaminidase domain-containing protein n=1 Tax=Flavobacterium sp. TaxID=239 RepID=UPI004048C517
MIKKIIYFIIVIFITSCGASRGKGGSHAKNRATKKTPNKTVTVTTRKIETKKPVVSGNTTTSTTLESTSEELEATSKVSVTYRNVSDYIDGFKDIAKQNMKEYGIPASITLAQGILESGAGNGRLSREANNHFGIKCHKEWNGPSITHDDDAAQECFRKYNDPSESYKDHSLFLTSRSRYNGLFKLDKGDYVGWAKGLKSAGYATDPKYPAKLISIIERYELFQYDNEILSRENTKKQDRVVVEEGIVNGATYEIQKGDTLYSISRKFNMSVDEIKKVNGLNDNSLSIGQKIKVK